jgi:outer membrane receptor protein involved in Fe transport
VQGNWLLTDELSVQGGVRGNYWSMSDLFTMDPRIAARMQVTKDIAIKASWGQFHQYLRLASAPDFTFFDTWLPTDNTVPAGLATHYILAVETHPLEGFDVNVDLYYKTLNNINELRNNQTRARTVANVFYIGDGHAYGAELFIQRKMGRLTGWIGYGLGFVFAQFDSVNLGAEFRPKYDRRHDIKINALYTLDDHWEFGASFIFQSGQSYTGATSSLGGTLPEWEGGLVMLNPSQRWGLRLPNSHQLNLNVNYNTFVWDLPFRVFLDVFNVYSRRDIWFRYYDTTKPVPEVTDVRLLPILPTISVELRF